MSDQFSADAKRLCPTCGAELPEGAAFCGACGSLVPGSLPASAGEAPTLLMEMTGAPTLPPDDETLPPVEEARREPASAPPAADEEYTPDQIKQNGHRRWDLGRLFRRE